MRLDGEHDLATAPAIRDTLRPITERGATVIDLCDATFIDSSVLGALIGAYRDAEEHGHGFALAIGSEPGTAVRRILELTGLSAAMPVHDEIDAAVRATEAPTGAGAS